jgi:hypothetical protein
VRGDREGAIADYTAAIELPNAPAPFVAVARLPRGNLRDERGDRTGASADYTAVIELANAHAEVVAVARTRLSKNLPTNGGHLD